MRKLILTLLVLGQFTFLRSQLIQVTGCIYDQESLEPLGHAHVYFKRTQQSTYSSVNGCFQISCQATTDQIILKISKKGYYTKTLTLKPTTNLELRTLFLSRCLDDNISNSPEPPEINYVHLYDNQIDNSSFFSYQQVMPDLNANRTAYSTASAFHWRSLWVNPRGMSINNSVIKLNGLVINSPLDNKINWSVLSGFYSLFEQESFSKGAFYQSNQFLGALGVQDFKIKTLQASQLKADLSYFNLRGAKRAYLQYLLNVNKPDIKILMAAYYQQSQNPFFKRTAQLISLIKQINTKLAMYILVINSYNRSPVNQPKTKQVSSLMPIDYDPNWGYYQGEKKYARYNTKMDHLTSIKFDYQFFKRTGLELSIGYQTNKQCKQRLNYQRVVNPSPIYYKKLPNFYISKYDQHDHWIPDYTNATLAEEQFKNLPQLSWNQIYRVNFFSNQNSTDGLIYLADNIQKDTQFQSQLNFRTTINKNFQGFIKGSFLINRYHFYKHLTDLLGASYLLDKDYYSLGIVQQYDVENLNKKKYVGDVINYNYKVYLNWFASQIGLSWSGSKVKVSIYQQINTYNYWRKGLFRSGKYLDSSLGNSEKFRSFLGGLNLQGKIDLSAESRFFMSVFHQSNEDFLNKFISVKYSNNQLDKLLNYSKNYGVNFSYKYHIKNFDFQSHFFYYQTENDYQVAHYFTKALLYHKNQSGALVNEYLVGVDKSYKGFEVSLDIKLNTQLTLQTAFNLGDYRFRNNPELFLSKQSNDQEDQLISYGKAYLRNRPLPTIQQTYFFGINYFSKKFWWTTIGLSHFRKRFYQYSMIRHTKSFMVNPLNSNIFDGLTSEKLRSLLIPSYLPNLFTLNLSIGKSWLIKRKTRNVKIVGLLVANHLLNRELVIGGFQQSRLSNYRLLILDQQHGKPNFGDKFFYRQGRTIMLKISLRY